MKAAQGRASSAVVRAGRILMPERASVTHALMPFSLPSAGPVDRRCRRADVVLLAAG